MQGVCIYHANRLVVPFWRPHSGAVVGRGVVGVVEADFLTPAPGLQSFPQSHALAKLEVRRLGRSALVGPALCEVIVCRPAKSGAPLGAAFFMTTSASRLPIIAPANHHRPPHPRRPS